MATANSAPRPLGCRVSGSYNRVVRIGILLSLSLLLAACHHGLQSKDAVRQGVIDYLASRGNLSVSGMDVDITSVTFNGNDADASVSITPKGGNPSMGMSFKYKLQQQGSKWVVVGRQDGGQSPHGAVAPDGASPHGGGAPGAVPGPGSGPGGGMPSPEALPPTGKKK